MHEIDSSSVRRILQGKGAYTIMYDMYDVVSMSKLENSTTFIAGSDDTAPGAGTSTLLEIGS